MKKVKLLTLTMVFAIMLMGVGYAAWNDVITVSTTVKTGNLDVKFVPSGSYQPAIAAIDAGSQIQNLSAVVGDASNGNPNDQLNVVAENLYPGARFYATAVAVNAGTIGTKLKNVTIDSTDSSGLLAAMKIAAYYHERCDAPVSFAANGSLNNPSYGGYTWQTLIPEQAIVDSSFTVDPGTQLEQGESTLGDKILLVFEFPFETPAGMTAQDYLSLLSNINFTVDFDWVQFNAQ